MWYSGSTYNRSSVDGIGYATSTNGLNWIKDINNPLYSIYQGVGWRNARCYTPSVLYSATKFDGNGIPASYKMWFTGQDNNGNRTIGTAMSIVGLHFTAITREIGGIRLDVSTMAGWKLTLQGCTNLVLTNWVTVATNIPSSNTWTYVDTNMATQRFYRAILL